MILDNVERVRENSNDQTPQYNGHPSIRRMDGSEVPILLWDQTRQYMTSRRETTPIQAGEQMHLFGQARIEPQQPYSIQYTDGHQSMVPCISSEHAAPQYSNGEYAQPVSKSGDNCAHPVGGSGRIYTQSVTGNSSYGMNVPSDGHLRSWPYSVDTRSSPYEHETYRANSRNDAEPRSMETSDDDNNPHGEQDTNILEGTMQQYSRGSTSAVLDNSLLDNNNISTSGSDMPLGASARDYAAADTTDDSIPRHANQLTSVHSFEELRRICLDSYKDAGILGLTEDMTAELSNSLLCYINVDTTVKCLLCKHASDISDKEHHKPECGRHKLSNMKYDESDQLQPQPDSDTSMESDHSENNYASNTKIQEQLKEMGFSKDRIVNVVNRCTIGEKCLQSVEMFLDHDTLLKETDERTNMRISSDSLDEQLESWTTAPDQQHQSSYTALELSSLEISNSTAASNTDVFIKQPYTIYSGASVTSMSDGENQIKVPPTFPCPEIQKNRETARRHEDTRSDTDISTVYLCRYCRLKIVNVTLSPCGHNICSICMGEQLPRGRDDLPTVCRCCQQRVTDFDTFFAGCRPY